MRVFLIIPLLLILPGCELFRSTPIGEAVEVAVHRGIDGYCKNVAPELRETFATWFITAEGNRARIECAADGETLVIEEGMES